MWTIESTPTIFLPFRQESVSAHNGRMCSVVMALATLLNRA